MGCEDNYNGDIILMTLTNIKLQLCYDRDQLASSPVIYGYFLQMVELLNPSLTSTSHLRLEERKSSLTEIKNILERLITSFTHKESHAHALLSEDEAFEDSDDDAVDEAELFGYGSEDDDAVDVKELFGAEDSCSESYQTEDEEADSDESDEDFTGQNPSSSTHSLFIGRAAKRARDEASSSDSAALVMQ